MRYDEGVENELKDWMLAAGDMKQLIAPRLVRDAIRAIRSARRYALLGLAPPKRADIKVQEYL